MIRLVLPLTLLGAYAASPYISLYEMGQAVSSGDTRTLCADIDWTNVREGLKEDIADGIAGQPIPDNTSPAVAESDDLPPFGASFVTNMAGNVVDRTVTPQHLAQTMHAMRAAGAVPSRPIIDLARFVAPTTFMVAMHAASAPENTVRLRLDLVPSNWGMRWEVTRAWIPEAMLAQSETHAS
jgi:hypothetical protein